MLHFSTFKFNSKFYFVTFDNKFFCILYFEKLKTEKIDITLPIRPYRKGKIHPVSQVIDEISSIFSEIGFTVAEGPDIETEYNNFTALKPFYVLHL